MELYLRAARANLSVWQREIFVQTARMQARAAAEQDLLGVHPSFMHAFNLTRAAVVSCPPGHRLSRIGSRADYDGSKWVCGIQQLQAPCHVLSLGSNGNDEFEKAVLALTPCHVYTFDCTMADKNLSITILDSARHMFIEKCIGSERKAAADPLFTTLARAMLDLGLGAADLIKIDIEGFEYDVLSTWGTAEEGVTSTAHLPRQMLVEVHLTHLYYGTRSHNAADTSNLMWPKRDVTLLEHAMFFSHLAGLGYATAHFELNEWAPYCAEYVLLRVAP
jgi:hypothetical protein